MHPGVAFGAARLVSLTLIPTLFQTLTQTPTLTLGAVPALGLNQALTLKLALNQSLTLAFTATPGPTCTRGRPFCPRVLYPGVAFGGTTLVLLILSQPYSKP